jgi:hypothetical protein
MRISCIVLILATAHADQEALPPIHDRTGDSPSAREVERPAIRQFSESISTLHVGTQPEHLSYHGFNEDTTVQTELLKEFRKRYPKLLAEALRSSGNMHNPKVLPLRAKFSECLLHTPTIATVNGMLWSKGYSVSQATLEKFEVNKGKDSPTFHAIVWLHIERLDDHNGKTEPGDQAKPATGSGR